MLEIFCKILFFLSMLVLYLNVSSTSLVILIVVGYIACVFTYYYFNNVRCAVDECFNYCNFNASKLSDSMNPSGQVSGYFVNRKFNKMNNNGIGLVGSRKLFSPLCSPDGTFTKENSLFDNVGTPTMKSDFKNVELRSPLLKNSNLLFRSNKLPKDKLKVTFSPKDIASRRYNSNLDMETYMNVNSPGFTSRVVDRAAESASYHLRYPAVRQVSSYRFDKSALRHLSRIPRVNSITNPTAVRIASPDVVSVNSSPEHAVAEDVHESPKDSNILQVLKEMSRKRNYSQEDDRSGSTPKKLRKNEMNVTTSSLYKRAHEDSPNDNPENERRKKRCDDTDRDIVKMMSYTSGLSVQGFSWDNQSKKRKSSKLEKSKNDSPEKLEKLRKISDDSIEETMKEITPKEIPITENESPMTICSLRDESENSVDTISVPANKTDKRKQPVSFIDEDEDEGEEYVCVAGGKILNRTNCKLRRKLNSRKIDPASVISIEPEYVCETNYVDDRVMKENILNNLVNNVERKEEKTDSVVFYHSSIFEEMANKVVVEAEVHKTDGQNDNDKDDVERTCRRNGELERERVELLRQTESELHQPTRHIRTASTVKPLQPLANKVTSPFNTVVATTAVETNVTGKPILESSKALVNEPTKSTNPLLQKQSAGFTFGSKAVDVVDSPQAVDKITSVAPSPKRVEPILTSPLALSTSSASNAPASTINHVTPSTISSPAAEEQKSSALSTSVTLPATSTLTSGSNASVSQNTNPLLMKSPPKTPGLVSFGKATETTSATPKITMFGNTVIPSTTVANSPPSNMFAKPATTISAFSDAVQLKSTTSPSFSFGQAATPVSADFNLSSSSSSVQSGFQFGASQPAVTTSSLDPNSTATATTTVAATSVFTTNASPSFSSSSFTPADKPPLFASASNSATQSFSFGGAQNGNVFGAASTTFANGPAQPAASVFGAQPTTTAASQPSVFGSTNTPSSSFGASAQPASASVFGTTTSQTQSSAFGVDCQSPIFGQSSSPAAMQSVFGNAARTVGSGDSGSGSMFSKPNQDAITSAQNSQFTFGASNQTATPTSSAFGAAAPAFGLPTFGANASASTFNFNSGPSNFGSSGSATNGTFAAGNGATPNSNPLFNFGSNVSGAATTAAQSTFPFQPTVPSQPSKSFVFGGGVTAAPPPAGGFSIGSGGGASSGRNRMIARPRKTK